MLHVLLLSPQMKLLMGNQGSYAIYMTCDVMFNSMKLGQFVDMFVALAASQQERIAV